MNSGSYWSRWDLHVHTPASFVQGYGRDDAETWDRFLSDLEALPDEVKVVGINDYMEVRGYRRVLDERKRGRLSKIAVVLPVVEFRLARFAGNDQWQRVNFHVIFSDQLDPETIESEFLSSVTASYKLDDNTSWSGPPLRARLEEFGRRIKSCAPPGRTFHSDLKTGFENFNVEPDQLRSVLDRSDAFVGKYMTAVGMAEWDQLRWTGSPAEKRSLVNEVDFVLTASPSEEQFRKGREKLKANTVQDRLLHSSDAHYLTSSSEPNRIGQSMTWVKAVPSFDGLLLARHEYDQRVFVGKEPPELRSIREAPTRYIKSVSFSRSGGSGPSWFNGAQILVNSGLVAIIGNKGSGKSAFTDALALVADTEVEEHLSFLRGDRFRQPRTGRAHEFTCSVTWHDDGMEQKSLASHSDPNRPERVRYLPQNYFERLCADIGDEAYEEFERELKRVVYSWLPPDQRLGRPTLDDLIEATTIEWRERHRLRVSQLSELNREIAALERQLEPATEQRLRSELAEKKRELDAHDEREPAESDGSDMSSTDAQDSHATARIDEIAQEVETLDGESTALASALAEARMLRQHATDVGQRLANVELYIDQQLRSEAATDALNSLGVSVDDILRVDVDKSVLDNKISEIDASIENTLADVSDLQSARAARLAEREELVRQLDSQAQRQRELAEARRRWQVQREGLVGDEAAVGSIRHLEHALASVPDKVQALAQLEHRRRRLCSELFQDLARLRDSYRELFAPIQEYLASEPLLTEGLVMTVDALIRDDDFAARFIDHIDRSRAGAFYQGGEEKLRELVARADFDEEDSVQWFVQELLDLLRPVANGRPSRDVDKQLRGRFARDAIYDFVFSLDYLKPHYALKFNGKEISQLSPGERGAALLIFYILVDKSNLPIVLDQPEENLDNETVSRLLVPAIRTARRRRQVIIVTHNPNLAVYCDADQVVLAEIDRGSDTRISYRSGAIEEIETRRWLVTVLEGTGPAFLKRHSKYSIGEHAQLVFHDA